MDFQEKIHTSVLKESFLDYYSGECPFCGSKNYKILDSWCRKIQEIGGPHRKVIVKLEIKTIRCLNPKCHVNYTPEHPMYP